MAYDRFLIGPINSGLQTNLKPMFVPEDAFPSLRNMYVWRGRLRKRFGSLWMGSGAPSTAVASLFSRVSVLLGNTGAGGNFTIIVPGNKFLPGQAFAIGTAIYTVWQTGTPADMLKTDATTTATFNTTNGTVNFVGAAGGAAGVGVYWYPNQPIMGICNYESGAINNQPSISFDTQFSYRFAGGRWTRFGGSPPTWHGSNSNFFWTSNWSGVAVDNVVLFASNFNATVPTINANDDPIWSYDGATWTNFSPYTIFNTLGDYVQTARIIVPFKDRLLLMNTKEHIVNSPGTPFNAAYKNRCRFSINGSPFATNAWVEPNQTNTAAVPPNDIWVGAGWIDAATEEEIISCEFIRDRLIVYFERSTWELAYTGNQVQPFVWQQVNTELGSESMLSTVPFDDQIFTIGNVGVHACTGISVQRIDNKIPDLIFEIENKNEGVERVAGIRDYYVEMVYWTFPSENENPTIIYPNRVLLYNYRNQSWAIVEDCITAFGYFEQQDSMTWASSAPITWAEAGFIWDSGTTEAQFRQVIAGNMQGYIFIVAPDEYRNQPVMQITNMTYDSTNHVIDLTIYDHTLVSGEYITIQYAQGVVLKDSLGLGTIYQVIDVPDANTVTVGPVIPAEFSGVYTGGGVSARVSNIEIISKQFNPYGDHGSNFTIGKIDFNVDKTESGQVLVDYRTSFAAQSMVEQGLINGSLLGNNVLETSPYPEDLAPNEQIQDQLWHTIYMQSQGETVQFNIYMTHDQMMTDVIAFSDIEINAIILYTNRTGRLQ